MKVITICGSLKFQKEMMMTTEALALEANCVLNVQKNIFGIGMGVYKQNIEEVILNKNYIIACYKK